MKTPIRIAKTLPVILFLILLTNLETSGQISTGSYMGDGTDGKTIAIGFQPDVVIVKVSETSNEAQIRTSTMPDGYSRQMVGSAASYLNRIKSFTPGGFVIGNHNDVNNPGKTYYWIAFKSSPGLKVGTYTGNGTDGRSITGLGFSPGLIFLLPAESNRASFRSSTFPDSDASAFGSDFNLSNTIESLISDGFVIGNDPRANKNGASFHYVAFQAIPGFMKVGSYVGNSTDNRAISGVGFSPVYMFIKSRSNNYATQKTSLMPNGTSIEFSGSRSDDNRIRELNPDGFTLGTQAQVNMNNITYHYVCFGNFVPSVLPITFDKFVVQKINANTLRVTFSFTEIEGKRFYLQLSRDGKNFQRVQVTMPDNPIVGKIYTVTVKL